MDFAFLRAEEADADVIAGIIRRSYEQLEQKGWYIADDAPYIRNLLKKENGIGYKAVDKETGTLAGFCIASLELQKEDFLKYSIGFTDEQCRRTAYMETSAVLPEYRGNRLQYTVMKELEQILRAMGFSYLSATVHPENHSSRSTLLKLGYESEAAMVKHGYPREIMLKTLD